LINHLVRLVQFARESTIRESTTPDSLRASQVIRVCIMSSSSWLRQALKRRPITSASIITVTGGLGIAGAVEAWSWEEEHRYNKDPSSFEVAPVVLPRVYDAQTIREYWNHRPLSAVWRLGKVLSEGLPLGALYMRDFVWFPVKVGADQISANETGMLSEEEIEGLIEQQKQKRTEIQQHHAVLWRQALTRLGPAFVKAGQQLSIRPDLVPPPVLKELQTLCDAVEPVSNDVAMQVLREELGIDNVEEVFDNVRLVASASLGQVYKAQLKSTGEKVAVKVQRPHMEESFSLDLFWLQKLGRLLDVFTSTFTEQPPFHQALYESFAHGSYTELDYDEEARQQMRFKRELSQRKSPVRIPLVHTDYCSRRVLTTEWIDGVKLVDASRDDIRRLIPVGVELFLTQLLDMGAFHADPQ
jgi:ABC1 atypical kinase-like domain